MLNRIWGGDDENGGEKSEAEPPGEGGKKLNVVEERMKGRKKEQKSGPTGGIGVSPGKRRARR